MRLHAHKQRVLRVKGILAVGGRQVTVHGVQDLVHPPARLREWPVDDRRSRPVFITQGLGHEVVGRLLSGFPRL